LPDPPPDHRTLRSFPTRRSSDLFDAAAEFAGLGLQLAVGEGLHLRFQRVDFPDDAAELLEQALVTAAEDAGEQGIEHGSGNLWRSEEHTSELQSREKLVCRLLLE